MKENNLIKQTCKDLGLTYSELAERVGYSTSAINSAARQDEISTPLGVAIALYVENVRLKKELEDFKTLKAILSKHI